MLLIDYIIVFHCMQLLIATSHNNNACMDSYCSFLSCFAQWQWIDSCNLQGNLAPLHSHGQRLYALIMSLTYKPAKPIDYWQLDSIIVNLHMGLAVRYLYKTVYVTVYTPWQSMHSKQRLMFYFHYALLWQKDTVWAPCSVQMD